MFRSIIIIVIVVAGAGQSLCAVEMRQPNIILIMADDLGYETIGANGGQSYETPQLDLLAAAGMRFERCHVQPLCTPTRVQLMTGIYNVRNYTQFGEIDPNVTTFAHLLKQSGYVTAVVGKWQLGRDKKLPHRLGFDEACLWQHTRRPPRYANPGLEFNGKEHDFVNGEYGPTLVNDYALDFITRHKDRPFFLYYPMILTHAPYQPTPESDDWIPSANGEEVGRNLKHFADMVAYMDKMIGRVVAKLEELALRDNTLIIFLGDNGTGRQIVSRFQGGDYPGGKGKTTASGTHVPLIVDWPARISSGGVCGDLIDSTDFLPTVCEAAGVDVPATLAIDGRSFLPQILGEKSKPREWIYCWYSRNGNPSTAVQFAMDKTKKLYHNGNVFDLLADPFETKPRQIGNLSGEELERIQSLQVVLNRYAHARPTISSSATDETTNGRSEKLLRKRSNAERKAVRTRP